MSNVTWKIYTWNKTAMSQASFQHSYCNHTCGDEQSSTSNTDQFCPDFQCFQCGCTNPRCEIYNICCPDISMFSSPNTTSMVHRNIIDDVSEVKTRSKPLNKFYHGSFGTNSTEKLPTYGAFSKATDIQSASNHVYVRGAASKLEPKIECDSTSYRTPFVYLRSCSLDVKVSDEVISRCQNDAISDDASVESVTRVVDTLTSVVYCNKYCAICNGVTEWLPWSAKIECLNYMRVYTATTLEGLLQMSRLNDSFCKIAQEPPPGLELAECDTFMFSGQPVDECNVTGLWSEYDQDVEDGCHSLAGHIYRVYGGPLNPREHGSRQLYKNIFCAICNQESYPTYSKCSAPVVERFRYTPPFSILLGIHNQPPKQEISKPWKACSVTEWLSPQGHCLPLHCAPGKLLVNGTCKTGLEQITGLGYRLRLWFLRRLDNTTESTYRIRTPPAAVIVKRFYNKLYSKLSPLINRTILNVTAVVNMSEMPEFYGRSTRPLSFSLGTSKTHSLEFPHTTNVTLDSTTNTEDASLRQFDFQVPFGYLVTGNVVASKGKSRDVFEKALLQEVLHGVLQVEFDYGVNGSFQPVVMWDADDPIVSCAEVIKTHPELECYQDKNEILNIPNVLEHNYVAALDYFLNYSELLTCSYLTLHRSMFIVEKSITDVLPIVILKVNLHGVNVTFSNESDLNMMSLGSNGTLNVCQELFDTTYYRTQFVSDFNSETYIVQYILTVLCLSISMLCLLLSLVTFAMFPILRSVAGRSNICLCTFLMLAQAATLASSHVSPHHQVVCFIVGIATHFLWLAVMCWSFLCCFHMFRVFTANTRSSHSTARSRNMFLAKNLTCSLLVPAVVVSTVVVVMYATSDGEDIGYGGSLCYLNSNILVGTTVALPLLSVSFINIGFFLLTVMHIHRVRKLQKHDSIKKRELQHLYVYIKLSTMTGSFWFLSITGEVLNLDAIRIAGILFNGLQGLFIFVSYICNKRVLVLYMHCLGIKSTVPTTTTDSSVAENTIMRLTTRMNQTTDQYKLTNKKATVCSDEVEPEDMSEAGRESSFHQVHNKSSTRKEQSSICVCDYQEDTVDMKETSDNYNDFRNTGIINPVFSNDADIPVVT